MRLFLHSMRRPRHPLARFLSLVLGLVVVGVLLVFGLAVVSVLLVGGLILLAIRQWKQVRMPAVSVASRQRGQPTVLEGEFRVIHEGRH